MVTSEQSSKYFSFEHKLLLIVEVVVKQVTTLRSKDAESYLSTDRVSLQLQRFPKT